LAKVITHDAQTGMYRLSDEDTESNKGEYLFLFCTFFISLERGLSNNNGILLLNYLQLVFNLPESQVIILGGMKSLSRGDTVFAVYPDTTSFYQAIIVQVSRKVGGGGSFVMVNFVDDSDENGITHDKAVLFKHIMLPPY
jgi:hypothetical protein